MDAGSNEGYTKTHSQTSTPSVSRQSSTVRLKSKTRTSTNSLRQTLAPPATDRTLTSFPSISNSLENSPENTVRKDILNAKHGTGTVRYLGKKMPNALDGLFDPPSPFSNDRSALFEDAPNAARDVPGTLHHLSDEHIQHLLDRTGAVALVRQLAQDLAQRDAHVSTLQQRAEEREQLLREMLKECEVSNLDIDNRLRGLERARNDQNTVTTGVRSGKSSRRESLKYNKLQQPVETVHDRLSQALDDALSELDADAGGTTAAGFGADDYLSSIHVSSRASNRDRDASSVSSGGDAQSGKSTAPGGWKTLFRYGSAAPRHTMKPENGIQASSNGTPAANPLNMDLFQPPPPELNRALGSSASLQEQLYRSKSHEPKAFDTQSQKSNTSVASWAMKLVAGNQKGQATSAKEPAARARAATVANENGDAGLMANPASTRGTIKNKSNHISDLYANAKKGSGDASRNPLANLAPPPSPQSAARPGSNLGPVEMDTILPEETRPPTLSQLHNQERNSEFLTDRFGFIYDQRRKRRQDDAAAAVEEIQNRFQPQSAENKLLSIHTLQTGDDDSASIDSRASRASRRQSGSRPQTPASAEPQEGRAPAKRWQDYLKTSPFAATELLSHTPSAAPITSVTTADANAETDVTAPQILVAKRGSAPAPSIIPAPSASRIGSGNAEISLSSASGTATPISGPFNGQPDPVKSLLDQLTEVHDSLQREKTVRWNEFLRKVRAERKREGEALAANEGKGNSAAMPEASLQDGEMIGVSGLGIKGKVGRAKWNEFRFLVLGGIPVAYRAKIWAECSGASSSRIPGYYDDLVKSEAHDPNIDTQIQMDITRTLTDNIFFRRGQGVLKLREVLLAYARRNPEIGYCQGMNLITACLLLIMPTAEDAFWVLVSMIEQILPEKYYDSSLLTSRADQVVLRQYVLELLPQLSNHLEELGIELEALTFQWFLSVFTDCLSAEALFRVWDVVLCINDGATFLFQVALALLKLNEKLLIACETPAEVYSYINQRMTDHAISIDGLVQASEGLKKVVKREEVEKRRQAAVERELEVSKARERVKKGKGRLVDGPVDLQPVEPTASSITTSTRASSLSREDEEIMDRYEELTARTPMPIDEEAQWRA